MNESGFDKWIKNEIEKSSPEYSTEGAWDIFAEKLKREETGTVRDDDEFDKAIAQKLKNHRVETPSSSWSQFIKFQTSRTESSLGIIRVKLMEAVAIVLLLITGVQWFEYTFQSNLPDSGEYQKPQWDSAQAPIIAGNMRTDLTIQPTYTEKVSQLNDSEYIQNDFTQMEQNSADAKPDLSASVPELTVTSPLPTYEVRLHHENRHLDYIKNQISQKKFTPEFQDFSIESGWTTEPDMASGTVITPSEITHPLLSGHIRPTYSEYPLILPMSLDLMSSVPRWFVSGYIAYDANLINTPFDKIYALTSYQREFLNSSLGIGFSRRVRHMEYQIDLGYSKRNYEPQKFAESFGAREYYYSEISLDRISFDIINPSFLTKYHFVDRKKWSAYLTATAALNVILNADYDITEIKILGRPPTERYLPENPRLEEKPFNEGLLSDNSLAENYFVSAGLGLGLEKTITHQTSLFLEVSHQRHLWSADIGIGPNKDKIHTTTFKVGLKKAWNSF
jgi:hypothetical protein